MRRANQPYSLTRLTLTLVVVLLIALVLILSTAVTSSAGHGFDQITLALPIFFVLLFLATTIGDWLEAEDFFIRLKPRLSLSPTRAPPA
jgi:hypothetical protein